MSLGIGFNTDFGGVSVLPWYANNEIYFLEVQFSVPGEEWSEFENSQMYQDLVQYQQDLRKRIEDKRTVRREQERKVESPALPETLISLPLHESFWVRVRNRLRNMLSR